MEQNETSMDYFSKKHKIVIHDYKTEDGLNAEHCGLIALELADKLIKEGKSPQVMKFSQYEKLNGYSVVKVLVPLQFEGRVKWGCHQICCADDIVYDPILETPISLKEYFSKVFGEDFEVPLLITVFSTEEIKQIFNKERKKK